MSCTIVIVAAINYAIAQSPPDPGHAWGEIYCSGCIQEANLADGAVTDAKIAGVNWSKLSDVPPGLDDGDDTGSNRSWMTTSNCCWGAGCPGGWTEYATWTGGTWGGCACGMVHTSCYRDF